MRLMNWK